MSIITLVYADLTEVSDKCPLVSWQKMNKERKWHYHRSLGTLCLISPNYDNYYPSSDFVYDKIETYVKNSTQPKEHLEYYQ